MPESSKASVVPTVIVAVLILALLGGGGYFGYRQWLALADERDALSQALTERNDAISANREEMARLNEALESTRSERDSLAENLDQEEHKNEVFEDQIRDLTGTVGKLDKLAQTDPELLRKYSKVYFLNENYIPEKLRQIDRQFTYNEERDFYLSADVLPFFEDMVENAKDDGVDLFVVSAYRSFDEQSQLKTQYSTTYGSGANAFSADQGYSEHQLGTTIDFTTSGINGGLDGFQNTEAYDWLTKNAYKYGFTLSYPKDNSYYVFEPWHWRFVGTDLARDLHKSNKHFYDLDQRELDEYLISIFD